MLLEVSVDNGAFFTVGTASSGSTATFSGKVDSSGIVGSGGVFQMSLLSGSSNSPGTSTLASLLSNSLSLQNLTNDVHTVTILIGDTGFQSLQTPPSLRMDSHVGGSFIADGSGSSITLQSFLDPNNGQNATTGAGILTTGLQTPVLGNGSFDSDSQLLISTLSTSKFSMTQKFVLTLTGGSLFNWGSNTSLVPVPEPTSLIVLGEGLPLILVGLWGVRRRSRPFTP